VDQLNPQATGDPSFCSLPNAEEVEAGIDAAGPLTESRGIEEQHGHRPEPRPRGSDPVSVTEGAIKPD
jgi:hypothetical protein